MYPTYTTDYRLHQSLAAAKSELDLYKDKSMLVRAYNDLADKYDDLKAENKELKSRFKDLRTKNRDDRREDTEKRKNLKEQYQKKIEKLNEAYEAELKSERIEKKDLLADKDQRIKELEEIVQNQQTDLQEAMTIIMEMTGQIQRIQAQLHQTSDTCSLPSSHNPIGTPKKSGKADIENEDKAEDTHSPNKQTHIPNNRTKSDRKQGGQPGHDGKSLPFCDNPDSVIFIDPSEEFLDQDKYEALDDYNAIQVLDIEIKGVITEYRSIKYRNLKTGRIVATPFPAGMKGPVTYGPELKALAIQLHTHGNMTYDKVAETIADLTEGKLCPSKATLCVLEKELSVKALPELVKIEEELLKSDTMHADCTIVSMGRDLPFGDNEADENSSAETVGEKGEAEQKADHKKGKTASDKENVLILTNGNWSRYTSHYCKGKQLTDFSILPEYNGILIHDAEATFFNYGSNHQCCIIHEARYLEGVRESEKDWGITWPGQLRSLLFELSRKVKEAAENNKNSLNPAEVEYYHKEYKRILLLAQTEYSQIPDEILTAASRQQDGLHVSRRLVKNEEYLLYCLEHTEVASDNNLAENRARSCKVHGKQSGGFKSREFVRYYCDCLSVLTSAHAQGKSRYKVIKEIIKRSNDTEAVPSVL